ncbi:glycosyltransferase, partial [Klebsiella pneumoniae]|uniref:glycosyltransferase n=1 Tax=Klebsiella pneumoniae TaxID=573 RepID=UPI0021C3E241
MTEKKGLRYAIQACDILNKSGYRFQYDIVGYGELNAELQQLISKYGLEDKVNIIGFQPQSVVKKLLMKSDVFLLPS